MIEPARRPTDVSDIPTPALLVDLPALDRNIARMAGFFAEGPCRLRPHFKAHKTPDILRRQLAAGGCCGTTVATVHEAEIAARLSGDILIANEVIDADACTRIAVLARSARISVAVDSMAGLDALVGAARRVGAAVGVVVDLDVGQRRCGVEPGEPAVNLARQVWACGDVHLRGVMGYEGHLQAVMDRNERAARTRDAMAALVGTAELFRAAGFPCDIVSSGGTGTYDISGRVSGVTEIQAGSYVLMDGLYHDLGLPFECAMTVLGTVISRPAPDRVVANCGHKSTTKDHGYPRVYGIAGATVTALHDEHATIAIPPASTLAIGDRVRLIPGHTDPTINLHDVFYVMEEERVVDAWPIAARGYGQIGGAKAPPFERT